MGRLCKLFSLCIETCNVSNVSERTCKATCNKIKSKESFPKFCHYAFKHFKIVFDIIK